MICQALSKALLELRSEMTSAAEQQVIVAAAQKEENLNVQMLVDKHTKELKVRHSSSIDNIYKRNVTTDLISMK